MLTDEQVKLYRKHLRAGKNQEIAAARAGTTAKTARKYEVGPLPSQSKILRTWRTRQDPFRENHWKEIIEPLLLADEKRKLQATTLLDELRKKHPEVYDESLLRTMQRRLRDWRAHEGPDKEVFFPQEHLPGRESQLDFTYANELQVTIAGEPLKHLFFELIMSYSGWRYVQIAYSENFESLCDGLQTAFWEIGGVTEGVRHDSLSAATRELKGGGRKLTVRFADLLEHYGVDSKRINVKKPHENGVVESGNKTLKNTLDQALIVRQSRDFSTLEAYLEFVGGSVEGLNSRCGKRLAEEKEALQPLPDARIPNYTEYESRVSRWSVIRVVTQVYSVPSRLIGEKVTVRLHPTEVEILYKGQTADRFQRLQGRGVHRIDYRHIIHSLVRKPGAFACYRFREDLFPTLVFRKAYDALLRYRGERAHVDYLQILHLAAKTMETDVEIALQEFLEAGQPFRFMDVETLVVPPEPRVEELVKPFTPELSKYDELLDLREEACV
jgi:hypothetical protein